jgi:hypothetical protein
MATDPSQMSDAELLAAYAMPALVQQESGGNGMAQSSQGALGSTQMLPPTAQAVAAKVGVPYRPELLKSNDPDAIAYQRQLGQAYLQQGIEHTGSLQGGLHYYHGGPDTRQWGPKTQHYAQTVMASLDGDSPPPASNDSGPVTAPPRDPAQMSDAELLAAFNGAAPDSASPEPPPGGSVPAGDGSIVNAKDDTPYNTAQTGTYKRLRLAGKLDPNAAGGSEYLPLGQVEPGVTPDKGKWYVDLNGRLQQSGFEPPQIAAVQPAPAPTGPVTKDQVLGFAKGIIGPANHLAYLGDQALGSLGIPMDQVNRALGFPTSTEALQNDQRALADAGARGVVPGKLGEVGGNMVVGAGLPGGPLVNGALTGAALSNHNDVGGLAADALGGAVGGKLGATVLGGLGRAVNGVADPFVKQLIAAGVPLTPGQLSGGLLRRTEDAMTSSPVLGEMIRSAKIRGVEAYNRATHNEALANIGQSLPDNVNVGQEAFNHTRQAFNDEYSRILSLLTVTKDGPWNGAVADFENRAAKLPSGDLQTKLYNILSNDVNAHFDPRTDTMSGEDLKGVQESLRNHISDLTGPNADKWSRIDAANLVRDLKGSLEGLVARTDPQAGADLARANYGYAHFANIRDATAAAARNGAVAAGPLPGAFTPPQMMGAVLSDANRAAAAGGKIPGQGLATAAMKTLPSTVPDSGTALRMLTQMALGGAAGHSNPITAPLVTPAMIVSAALASLYTKVGQKALIPAMTGRPAIAQEVGKNIRRFAPLVGTGGAVTVSTANR